MNIKVYVALIFCFLIIANIEFAYGTVYFQDGFESGTTNLWDTQIGTVTVQSATKRTGSYSAKFVNTTKTGQHYIGKNISQSEIYFSSWLYFEEINLPSESYPYESRLDLMTITVNGGPNSINSLILGIVNYTGTVQFYALVLEAGPGNSSITVSTGQWYGIELHYKYVNASYLYADVWINNQILISGYGFTSYEHTPVNVFIGVIFWYGHNAFKVKFYADDCVCDDTKGTPSVGYVPETKKYKYLYFYDGFEWGNFSKWDNNFYGTITTEKVKNGTYSAQYNETLSDLYIFNPDFSVASYWDFEGDTSIITHLNKSCLAIGKNTTGYFSGSATQWFTYPIKATRITSAYITATTNISWSNPSFGYQIKISVWFYNIDPEYPEYTSATIYSEPLNSTYYNNWLEQDITEDLTEYTDKYFKGITISLSGYYSYGMENCYTFIDSFDMEGPIYRNSKSNVSINQETTYIGFDLYIDSISISENDNPIIIFEGNTTYWLMQIGIIKKIGNYYYMLRKYSYYEKSWSTSYSTTTITLDTWLKLEFQLKEQYDQAYLYVNNTKVITLNYWYENYNNFMDCSLGVLSCETPTTYSANFYIDDVYIGGELELSEVAGGEPQIFLIPFMFIFGMIGLVSTVAGPMYLIYKVKNKEYYQGFVNGLLIFIIGVAFVISWLWG